MNRLILIIAVVFGLLLQACATAAEGSLGLKGAVNIDCQSSSHSPVVLLHGTFANAKRAYSSMAPVLKDKGYCLYALNYGKSTSTGLHGMQDIHLSVQEVASFAESVLKSSGAKKISLVGHSQGGLIAFLVANTPELAGRVDRIVAIAPSLQGTSRVPANIASVHCPACVQLGSASSFQNTLKGIKLNPPGVQSLILATKDDLVVTPVESQFLNEQGVTNLYIQDRFPRIRASHSGLLHVPEAIDLVETFLSAK